MPSNLYRTIVAATLVAAVNLTTTTSPSLAGEPKRIVIEITNHKFTPYALIVPAGKNSSLRSETTIRRRRSSKATT
jgi:hypothetical protein